MRTDAHARREALEAWAAENLRLTVFSEFDREAIGPDWLAQFIGDESINVVEDRKTGARNQTVPYEGGDLTLATFPGVITWVFVPSAIDAVPSEAVPFTRSLEAFKGLALRWLGECREVQRIAFGAVLRLPVESRESGYNKLGNYLNFEVDPRNSFDFSYQINHPRNHPIAGGEIKVNRLTRWSVATSYRVSIIPPAGAASGRKGLSHCRLELDVNTDQEYGRALTKAELPDLFTRLVTYGTEIASEGDIL